MLLLPMMPYGSAREGREVRETRIEKGEVAVVFRDNSESPRVLSGIDSLVNLKWAPDYDAYHPSRVEL